MKDYIQNKDSTNVTQLINLELFDFASFTLLYNVK